MLLADMHLRGASIADHSWRADSALEVPASGGTVFHLLLDIPERIRLAHGDTHIEGVTGDVFMVPGGGAHVLGHGPLDASLHFGDESHTPVVRHAPTGRARFVIMSAKAHFDEELARPFVTALPAVFRIAGENGRLPPWMAIGVQFIREELDSPLPAQQAVINRVAEILLIECLRRHVAGIPADSQSWLRALRDPALSRALAALHAQPAHPWSVERLARVANLSRSAFAERFVRCIDQTPMAYLAAHRLRRAAWSLRHTGQPIARIAEDAGYGSASAFTQAFERHMQCSPRRYRDAVTPRRPATPTTVDSP